MMTRESPRVVEVVSLPDLSLGLPAMPEPVVERPHYLVHIANMLEGDSNLLVLDGPEGIGKSILAAQFVRQAPERTFSLFISGSSSMARSPEYLLSVLCDQIYWFFHNVRMPLDLDPEPYIRSACLQLRREATSMARPFIFVIDGLLQLREIDPTLVDLMLTDYLPVGIPGFKFLLTGDPKNLPLSTRKGMRVKDWELPPFGLPDTRQLLSDFGLSDETKGDIHKALGGTPGKIASLRRSLLAGVPREQIEKDLPGSLAELFALEWQATDPRNELQLNVLAMIAHARHDVSLQLLARALDAETSHILDSVGKLQFVRYDADSHILAFTSNQFRAFVVRLLKDKQEQSIGGLADALMGDITEVSTFEQIPTYLRALGRGSEVLDLLTIETLSSISSKARSFRPIMKAVHAGVQIATSNEDCVSALRAVGQYAVIDDLSKRSFIQTEVEAYLALGQAAKALVLVQSSLLKEDRLEGLSLILRHQGKSGLIHQ